MRTGVEQTRSQKEKAQREESKDASPPSTPADAQNLPKPKEELERRPVLALALVSFVRTLVAIHAVAATASQIPAHSRLHAPLRLLELRLAELHELVEQDRPGRLLRVPA